MIFYRSLVSTILVSCLLMSIVQGAKLNICDWIYCNNGGTCQQGVNSIIGFQCRCQFGFSGLLCEDRVNITRCVQNPCKNNGICSITNNRIVQCTCPRQYTGNRCETMISNTMK